MRPNWKEVPKDEIRAQWAGLYVSLNPKGQITFSRVTWNKMGAPVAFVILFDSVNNRIGLKPAYVSTRNAYKVGPTGKHGGKRILAYRMMREYRISLPETIELTPKPTKTGSSFSTCVQRASANGHAIGEKTPSARPRSAELLPAIYPRNSFKEIDRLVIRSVGK